jgi:hypothetical protein
MSCVLQKEGLGFQEKPSLLARQDVWTIALKYAWPNGEERPCTKGIQTRSEFLPDIKYPYIVMNGMKFTLGTDGSCILSRPCFFLLSLVHLVPSTMLK